MKTKHAFVAICLGAALLSMAPISQAAEALVPQDVSAAPAVSAAALRQLQWTPVGQGEKKVTRLAADGQPLSAGEIAGPVAAYRIPASVGDVTVTLSSDVRHRQVFAPNVLVLDGSMTPSAFFPSRHFAYQGPGVMALDRLQGELKLTPAPGQQFIYLLVFTTRQDLQQTTTLLDPAKAYAKGTGNAVPDIADPIARHTPEGTLTLAVKTSADASVLVGPLFGSSRPEPVVVGGSKAAGNAVPPLSPAPVLSDTEDYFNQAIRQAVARDEIDKALTLLNEAERLGVSSARKVFIDSVGNRK
ncbi:maltose operon protein MalM [Brenneria tiliae]|uniref:maltose operon protein MalM n=1 Tax=Brenneria tiliae TaxID=2914984 RepID=UPI002014907C|nr:maltose operon protein MalM [Brenneria tiliae]MCL2899546.1 maltose operon protein MalM [Brenneria tiliae]MCL2903924.1 maltose operon protein MalM [Brenneria tiliae]